MANHHGWSIVNFSASKMHLPHHRRTSKFPWSPVATYSVNCKTHHLWHCLGGATTAGPNPSAKTIKTSLQNYIAMLRYPRIPHEQTCDCYYCIVLLASPLVNCHAGVIEFNTHIVSSPQHVTGVLIMWSCAENYGITRKALVCSGITFAGLLFGLAATPQKPLQNLGRLLVVQQCRALWKFMTCFFQTPQTHQLSVHCWTVSAYWLKNQKKKTILLLVLYIYGIQAQWLTFLSPFP